MIKDVKYSYEINKKERLYLYCVLFTLVLLGVLFGLKVKESGNSAPMLFIAFWVLAILLYWFKLLLSPSRIDILVNDKARFVGPFSKVKTIPLGHINVIESHKMSMKIVARNRNVRCNKNIKNFDKFVSEVKQRNPYLITKGM